MRIVSGIVSKGGDGLAGGEYSVSSRASGEGWKGHKVNIYDIVFDPPFAAPPAITVTAEHRFRGSEDKMFGPYIDKIDTLSEREAVSTGIPHFCARVLAIHGKGPLMGSDSDPGHGSACAHVRSRTPLRPAVGSRRTGLRVAVVGRAVSTRSSGGRVE